MNRSLSLSEEMSILDLKNAFKEQQRYVNYFFDNLNMEEVESFAHKIRHCEGMVFFTGMGKSGIVARNISQMMVSIGIRSMFVSPVDALHGDLGVIGKNDILVLMSKSGQSSELMTMAPAARAKGAYLVAMVSNPDGNLVKVCDTSIHLPLERELCPFDLAPTTSTIIQLAFGNTVVACLMRGLALTKEAYALNHPAGRIGKRLTVRVSDVMRKLVDLPICNPSDKLMASLPQMTRAKCGCLLICDSDNNLLGLFTDGDLRRRIEDAGADALTKSLSDVMTKSPSTIRSDAMAWDAMQEMERSEPGKKKKRVKELPVVNDEGKVVGLILLHDLVQAGL